MANNKVFAVIGLGTFGVELCLELSRKGGKVIAIDKNTKQIEKVKEFVYQAILIDSTDEDVVKKAPLESVDIAVVAIAEDIQSSILTTAVLKRVNVPHIIARASSEIHAQILGQIGATEVINIEVEEGKRMATKLISPNVIEQIQLSDNFVFAEIMTPKFFIGKTIPELDIRNKYNISVVTIKRKGHDIDEFGNPKSRETIIFPDPHEKLQETDILVIVGEEQSINKLKES